MTIRPAIAGLNDRDMKFEFVHVHTLRVEGSASRPVVPPTLNKEQKIQAPNKFALHNSYPNPFNPSTQITFDLPEDGHVTLAVYDMLGRKVADLVNENFGAGYHSATWDASGVSSGVYFARFTATDVGGNVKLSKITKLILNK